MNLKDKLGNKLGIGKHGALTDIFLFMIVGFVLCILVVMFLFIATKLETELHQSEALRDTLEDSGKNSTEVIDSTVGMIPDAYDSFKWITTMLLVGMLISILVTSFLVRVNPIFFVPYIFIMIIAGIVSFPLSNVYERLLENPILASSFEGFYGQTYIFLNLPYWVIGIMLLAGIVLFVNMIRQEGQYGGYG